MATFILKTKQQADFKTSVKHSFRMFKTSESLFLKLTENSLDAEMLQFVYEIIPTKEIK